MFKDYFAVFSLEQDFDIDLQALEKAYFSAQRMFHPDRLIGKGPLEQQQAILQSMLINEAYETLKSPLERAKHLLALSGIRVGGEQDSIKPSHAVLMEIMELREALADAKAPAAIMAIESDNSKAKEKAIADLSTAFREQNLPQAAEITIRLGYLMKVDDEIRVRKKGLAA